MYNSIYLKTLRVAYPKSITGIALVLMAFLGCANVYALRVNLSVAIVAMVGNTSKLY